MWPAAPRSRTLRADPAAVAATVATTQVPAPLDTDFDPDHWTLAEHGDSRQRRWAARITGACPAYERFWQRHIVPLTFRPHQPDNYFVRPTQRRQLLDLADRSYAMLLHLMGTLDWSDGLLNGKGRGDFRPTDCAYYFFSHAYSLREAGSGFADAVNQVLERYKSEPVFAVSRNEAMQRWEWKHGEAARRWRDLRDATNDYRNALVHERPLLVQTRSLPARDRTAIRELSGLTAITRLARDEKSLDAHCVAAEKVVLPILGVAEGFCDELWKTACGALDAIENPRYRKDQLAMRQEDSRLTLEKIHHVRGS